MSEQLPAFAAVLRDRNLRKSANFSQTRGLFGGTEKLGDSQQLMAAEPPRGDRLLGIRDDLERQLTDLLAEGGKVRDLKADLEREAQLNSQLRSDIQQTKEKVKQARAKGQRLEDQVRQLQIQLDNKRRQAQEHDNILTQLQFDYTSLSVDRRKLTDKISEQRDQIQEGVPIAPDFFELPAPLAPVELSLDSTSNIPLAEVESFIEPPEQPKDWSENIDYLSVEELRDVVDQLQKEKADIQWQMQRAPPPGVPMVRVRREKYELDEKLDEVLRKIGKVKLVIRQKNVKS
jgi:hypothetical protein